MRILIWFRCLKKKTSDRIEVARREIECENRATSEVSGQIRQCDILKSQNLRRMLNFQSLEMCYIKEEERKR